MKNKLTQYFVFLFFLSTLILSVGCSAKTVYKTDPESYAKGFKDADMECIQIQKKAKSYINNLQKEIAVKDVVLDKFKQLDKKGKLKSNSRNTSWNDPAGDEPWLK